MTRVDQQLTGGILTLTLQRPERRNALDRVMLDALAEALARAELDAEVRVVALRGAGPDFCAGADLDELLASADASLEENERHALLLGEIFLALRRLPKPTVALVTGRALAGGAGLALACDLVLAHEGAAFGFPEITRGFVPAMVMTLLRRAVGEKHAFELVATGRSVAAGEALTLGLASRVHGASEYEVKVEECLATLNATSPTAFALTKQLFLDLDERNVSQGILLGARVNALSRSTDDFRATVAAYRTRG